MAGLGALQLLLRELAEHVEVLASKAPELSHSDGLPKECGNEEEDFFERCKTVTKAFYDSAKMAEARMNKGQHEGEGQMMMALPELAVEGFDAEQVWAGVELQNQAVFDHFRSRVSHLMLAQGSFDLLQNGRIEYETSTTTNRHYSDESSSSEEEEECEEEDQDEKVKKDKNNPLDDPDFQHMSDSDLDDLPLFDKVESEQEDQEDLEELEELEEEEIDNDHQSKDYMQGAMEALRARSSSSSLKRKSGQQPQQPRNKDELVEDRFFKLDEMQQFLEAEDLKETRKYDNENEEDHLELFEGFSSEESDQEKSTKVMYSDLFGPVENNQEIIPAKAINKSSFELRQERLQAQVSKMEDEALKASTSAKKKPANEEDEGPKVNITSNKPWQLKGEVGAADRPINSLLQEHLDYDDGAAAAKRAPIITEAVSKRLEDIIRQRVKDGAYDDVERKVKPLGDNPYDYKKRLVLDQEKSQLSLAQIYEQEYLKQKQQEQEQQKVASGGGPLGMLEEATNEEDNEAAKAAQAIRKDMRSLFAKLDALTHFHFTPSAGRTAEVRVVKNAPTLTMEEVAPIAMSDANLLAPQEVVDRKRGEQIGATERGDTDKKRERRKKKRHQGLKAKLAQEKATKANTTNNNNKKADKEKLLKELKKKNTGIEVDPSATGSGKAIRSSSKFFDQLQSEVQSSITTFKAKGNKAGGTSKSGQKLVASNFKL